MPALHFDTRKVGGIRFVKIGRLTLSFSVSAAFRPIGAGRQPVPFTIDVVPNAASVVAFEPPSRARRAAQAAARHALAE